MAKLIKCHQCGKKVSSNAKSCPYCNKSPKKPRYYTKCLFCKRPGAYYHRKCLEDHINKNIDIQQFLCPTCHEIIKYPSTKESPSYRECPKCGEPFRYESCDICKRWVEIHSVAIKTTRKIREWDSWSSDPGVVDSYKTFYFHPSCYPYSQEYQQEKKEQKSRIIASIVGGLVLGFVGFGIGWLISSISGANEWHFISSLGGFMLGFLLIYFNNLLS